MKTFQFDSIFQINRVSADDIDKIYIPESVSSSYIEHISEHVDRTDYTLPCPCLSINQLFDSKLNRSQVAVKVCEIPKNPFTAKYVSFGEFYNKYMTESNMTEDDFKKVEKLLFSSDPEAKTLGLNLIYSFKINNKDFYAKLLIDLYDNKDIITKNMDDFDFNAFFDICFYCSLGPLSSMVNRYII